MCRMNHGTGYESNVCPKYSCHYTNIIIAGLVLVVMLLTGACGSKSFDPDWFRQYEDVDGYYYNADDDSAVMLSAYDGDIYLTNTDYMWSESYSGEYSKQKDKTYLYPALSLDDSSELLYDPADGSITVDGISYVSLQEHGRGYTMPESFYETWYTDVVGFTDVLALGSTVTFSWFDDGEFSLCSDMLDQAIAFQADEYTAAANGGVYYTGSNGEEMYYYPDHGLLLLLEDPFSSRLFRATDELPVSGAGLTGGHYIMETVYGSDVTVHVFPPYWTSEYGAIYIQVLCQITNMSGNNLWFNAADYFTLNNNATITTFIKFRHDESSVNVDYNAMTLTVAGTDVSLTARPQYGEEYDGLPGVYYYNNYRLYIEDLYNGQYYVCETLGSTSVSSLNSYHGEALMLSADNSFVFDGKTFYWHPEAHEIECPFSGFSFVKE